MLVVLATTTVSTVVCRTRLAKIIRKSPSFGTLHSVELWYNPLERSKPLPAAKKTFNFTRSDHLRMLASFATSTPRAVLTSTFDADVREVAAFFAERITLFAEQKTTEAPPVTSVFRMNVAIKNMAVTLRLSRSKSQKLRGNITFHGYLKAPSPELVNLITAAVIDDAPSTWRRWLVLLAGCFAWLKWGEGRDQGPSRANFKQDVAIQTDAEAESSTQDDASQAGFVSLPAIKPLIHLAMHTQSVGIVDAHVPPHRAEVVDVGMQTDVIDGSELRANLLRARGVSGAGVSKGDTMPEISAGLLYGAVVEYCFNIGLHKKRSLVFRARGTIRALLPEFMIQPSRREERLDYDYLYDSVIAIKNTYLLDDGTLWFGCSDGTARVVIHKSHEEFDIERLLQERACGLVRSDVIFIVHCVDATSQKRHDVGRFLHEQYQSLDRRYDHFRRRLEGFLLLVVVKMRSESLYSFMEKEAEHKWFLLGFYGQDRSILNQLNDLQGCVSGDDVLAKLVCSVRGDLARRAEARRCKSQKAS